MSRDGRGVIIAALALTAALQYGTTGYEIPSLVTCGYCEELKSKFSTNRFSRALDDGTALVFGRTPQGRNAIQSRMRDKEVDLLKYCKDICQLAWRVVTDEDSEGSRRKAEGEEKHGKKRRKELSQQERFTPVTTGPPGNNSSGGVRGEEMLQRGFWKRLTAINDVKVVHLSGEETERDALNNTQILTRRKRDTISGETQTRRVGAPRSHEDPVYVDPYEYDMDATLYDDTYEEEEHNGEWRRFEPAKKPKKKNPFRGLVLMARELKKMRDEISRVTENGRRLRKSKGATPCECLREQEDAMKLLMVVTVKFVDRIADRLRRVATVIAEEQWKNGNSICVDSPRKPNNTDPSPVHELQPNYIFSPTASNTSADTLEGMTTIRDEEDITTTEGITTTDLAEDTTVEDSTELPEEQPSTTEDYTEVMTTSTDPPDTTTTSPTEESPTTAEASSESPSITLERRKNEDRKSRKKLCNRKKHQFMPAILQVIQSKKVR